MSSLPPLPLRLTMLASHVVRVVLGVLLLSAAGLKVHGLTLTPLPQGSILTSPQLQFVMVALEIALGLWLLSGWAMRASRAAALGFFSVLMIVSLYLALAGQPSCGCLGRVTVSPWWTFALDVTAVAALGLWPPPRSGNIPPVRWRPRLLIVGSGVAALLGFVAGNLLVPADNSADSRTEWEIDGLVVAADALDLGEVWENRSFVCRLPIKNRTIADIKVQDMAVSCGCCMGVEPRSLTIAAGQTETVTLKLDLSQRRSADLGKAERPFSVEAIPLIDRNRRPNQPGWILHGTVKSRVTTDVLTVQFGDRPMQGQPPVTRKVAATVHVPVQRLEAVAGPKVASVEVRPGREGTNTFELFITPQPSLPTGPFQTQVAVTVVSPDGERLPGVVLPIEGVMQPEVRPIPARVLFGLKPLDEVAEATVILQAPEGIEIAVEQFESDSPDIRVKSVEVAGIPDGRAFRVTQRVSKAGEQTSVVRFNVRKAGQEMIVVPVEVTYRGEELHPASEDKDTRKVP